MAIMRRHDILLTRLLVFLFLQLSIGTLVVTLTAQRERPTSEVAAVEHAVDRERIRSQAAALEARMATMEAKSAAMDALRVDPRLSVLEQGINEIGQVKTLVYGMIATLLGNLAISILQVRSQRAGRVKLQ